MDKNTVIKNTIASTRERHTNMVCRVFEVKIISGKLSKTKKSLLDQYFLEGKWLRNSELAKGDIASLDRKAKTARVKVGDIFEERPLNILGSQIKQDIVDSIKSEIKGLSTKKSKGQKVGKLKFKSFCNSIPLRQYGTTYNINFKNNTVTIQNMSKYPLKVRGLKQIPKDAEIANARLVRKPSGYYIHITTFSTPECISTGAMCGVDFGIGTNMTFNNGEKVNIEVPETKGVILASRRVNKAFKRNGGNKSKNHHKRTKKLRRAYEHQTNIKHDKANKIVSRILNENDLVAIQNELIAAWHHGIFGKQVQHSAMGYIKAKLKTNSKTIVIPSSFPSTQNCPICGKNTKHPLSKRSFECSHCGYTHPDRDIKAANMILIEALEIASNDIVSMERRTKSPAEVRPADDCMDSPFAMNAVVKVPPVKQEAHVL